MSSASALPLDLPQGRAPRVRRASAGQRRGDRVTSVALRPEDEVLLDALRDHYGTTVIGEAIRRALRDAATAQGLPVGDQDTPEAIAA